MADRPIRHAGRNGSPRRKDTLLTGVGRAAAPSSVQDQKRPTPEAATTLWPPPAAGNLARSPEKGIPEAVDGRQVALAQSGVAHAEAFDRGQAPHADLALVPVAVDLVGGLAGLLQWIGPRECRMDLAAGDQPVGLPRFAV